MFRSPSPDGRRSSKKSKNVDIKEERETPSKKRGRKLKAAPANSDDEPEGGARPSKKARADSLADSKSEDDKIDRDDAVVKEEYED